MSDEANIASTQEKEPQVTAQQNELNFELDALEKLMSLLHGRLIKVLRNSEPLEQAKDRVETEIVCFAHEIRVQRRRVHASNSLIGDILDRIEL